MALGDDDGGTVGEGHRRLNLSLPGHQEQLLEAVAVTGRPIVLLLMNGRRVAINRAADHIQAIVELWFLGQQTGDPIADVLSGKCNPGAKLAISLL
jgi:beta-glucosidase